MRRLWCRTRWSVLAEEEKEEAEKDANTYSNVGAIIKPELRHQSMSFGEAYNDEPLDNQMFCQMNKCISEGVPVIEIPVQKQEEEVPMVTKVQRTVEVHCAEYVDHHPGILGHAAGEEAVHYRHHHIEVEQVVDIHVPHEKEVIEHVPKIVQQERIIQQSVEQEEEAEEELYSQRSKLFRFRDGEWKERGVGEAKLLQHHETRRVRFMFRHEKTGKTVSNHYPLDALPHCVLHPNAGSDKAWVWSTPDYAEEEVEVERFALKFGYPELAKAFKAAFDEAKVLNGAKMLNEKTGDAPQATGDLVDIGTQADDPLALATLKVHSACNGDLEDLRQEVMDSRREIKRQMGSGEVEVRGTARAAQRPETV